MNLTVLILTHNEAMHIERAMKSVSGIADRVVVVDSGSSDNTVGLAMAAGAEVIEHPWVNYASQMNWGLKQLGAGTDWVLRLDADEIVSDALSTEIATHLPEVTSDVHGVFVSRRMLFLGRPIRWGGVFPIRVLRLFRHGLGRVEERWMDEHIVVSGSTIDFSGDIVDHNLNSITWWIEKHNGYASREVVDLLNLEFGFMEHETVAEVFGGRQVGFKRWVKERIYAKLPGGSRAVVYFLFRYFLRLGFLDGREGAAFHLLQGLWYRYLVDTKLFEVRKHMDQTGDSPVVAIREVLGIDIR